jgi:uncharacterized protein with ACT and thioredoxin-like domain
MNEEVKQRKPRATGPRSGVLGKVLSQLGNEPKTIADIKSAVPELKDGQISSAFCHLVKGEKVSVTVVPRVNKAGRKEIKAYTLRV